MNCAICKAPGVCICEPLHPCDTIAINEICAAVAREVLYAKSKWPPLNSAHEAYAVLLEELDELKMHVWTNQKRRDVEGMRREAIQVAAMAVRFVQDVCNEQKGRK